MHRFAQITDWVFDLDNTLYPAEHNLFSQVDQRMTAFIAEELALAPFEARRLQKLYLRDYGTTLAGLMAHHNMPPEKFLDFVHDVDISVLPPDPQLEKAINKLPGRKFIFTNGTRAHAERVAGQLGILHLFDDIYDIVEANYIPKPHPNIYPHMLARFNLRAETTAFFEDLSRNLAPAHQLGMTTILIDATGTKGQLPDWESLAASSEMAHSTAHHATKAPDDGKAAEPAAAMNAAAEDHIHHTAADLVQFLDDVAAHIAERGAID